MAGRCATCSTLIDDQQNCGVLPHYICKPCFDLASESSGEPSVIQPDYAGSGSFKSQSPRNKMSGNVIAGIGMMVGAVIWFVVGYSLGYIYFYPPILFIFGLIRLFKGLLRG